MKRRIRDESLSARPRAPSELAGAADRAGALVRDQISSMTEAARSSAAGIERTARDSADDTRRQAVESAARTVGNINRLERELTLLLRGVSQEADGLRGKLERLLLPSAPLSEPAEGLEVAGGADTTEAGLLPSELEQGLDPPVDAIAEVEAESAFAEAGAEGTVGEVEGEVLFPDAEGEVLFPDAEGEVLFPDAEGEALFPDAEGELALRETEMAPASTEAGAQPPFSEAAVEPPSVEGSLEAASAEAGEEEKVEQTPEGESFSESFVEAGPEGASEPDSDGAEGPPTTERELDEAGAETAVSPDLMEPSDRRTPDEGRGLRGKLERLLVPSVPLSEPAPLEVAGGADTTEAGLLSSGLEQAQDPRVDTVAEVEAESAFAEASVEAGEDEKSEQTPEGESVAESLDEAGPEGASEPDSEGAEGPPTTERELEEAGAETAVGPDLMEPSDRRRPDEGREERALAGLFGGDVTSPTLDEEARRRVAEKSDLELSELYSIAAKRASANSNDEDQVYWVTLVRATVEESLARPDFGRPPQGVGGGRKAKKRRSKALDPLMAAREEALAQRGENAGPR